MLQLERLDLNDGKGIAILTIQAGLGIVAADIIETNDGRLARFGTETVKKLHELLPPITMRENPVDLSFSGLDLNVLLRVIDAVSQDDDVGIIMFLYAVAPPSWVIPTEVIKGIIERIKKPAIVVYSPTPDLDKKIENVLVFDSIERGAKTAIVCSMKKRNNF